METFAERYWDEALLAIPDGAELISVENEVSCRVEMMDIFYHVPGEKKNHYMRAMTKTGKTQAEMLTGEFYE